MVRKFIFHANLQLVFLYTFIYIVIDPKDGVIIMLITFTISTRVCIMMMMMMMMKYIFALNRFVKPLQSRSMKIELDVPFLFRDKPRQNPQ